MPYGVGGVGTQGKSYDNENKNINKIKEVLCSLWGHSSGLTSPATRNFSSLSSAGIRWQQDGKVLSVLSFHRKCGGQQVTEHPQRPSGWVCHVLVSSSPAQPHWPDKFRMFLFITGNCGCPVARIRHSPTLLLWEDVESGILVHLCGRIWSEKLLQSVLCCSV